MAYFSNGSEGSAYEAKYCENCIHWVAEIEGEHKSCPVWDIHALYNYGRSEGKDEVMDSLIPRSKDKLSNEQCTMFIQVKSEGQTGF